MACTEEDQSHEAFEVIEHSDVLGTQCQEAATATALTEMEKKVREMEQRLEEEMAKTKAATALKPVTLVLMWTDVDEFTRRHEAKLTVATVAEAHVKAYEAFRAFKLEISQVKDAKAILHDITNFSQLDSACFEPFDEGDVNLVRTANEKLACQDTFYLSFGVDRWDVSEKAHKTNGKNRYEWRMDGWKKLVPQCEHIVVWHLNNKESTAVLKSLNNKLSKHDKLILLGRSCLAPIIKKLVENEVGTSVPSGSSTAKPVPSNTQTEQPQEPPQSTSSAILGSTNPAPLETKTVPLHLTLRASD